MRCYCRDIHRGYLYVSSYCTYLGDRYTMKFLPAQRMKSSYFFPIEIDISRMFYGAIYKPILTIMRDYHEPANDLLNSIDVLVAAFNSGNIMYENGNISGKFNAKISYELRKIGAKFNKVKRCYTIDPINLPSALRVHAAQSARKAQELHDSIKKALDDTYDNLTVSIPGYDLDTDKVYNRMHGDVKRDLRGMVVLQDLNESQRKKILQGYTDNVRTYAKNHAIEQFKSIRKAVEENATEGNRYDSLQARIEHLLSVSRSKANFIARQETSNFMSSFHEALYSGNGVEYYKWSARPVARPDHRALNGRIFRYDTPPIVDRSTGRRGNPGQDFGCLCVDIPMLGYVWQSHA